MTEKKTIKREDVKDKLIKDAYFEKGNFFIKTYQSAIALLSWLGFFLPFIWLALPYLSPLKMERFQIFSYFEEIVTFKFLFYFLSIAFLIIAISYFVLTLFNNYRFKNMLQKEEQYNARRLKKREVILEKGYIERFGAAIDRKKAKYYSVSEEQNLSVNFVKTLFEKESVN